jgi:hypothetical protein
MSNKMKIIAVLIAVLPGCGDDTVQRLCVPGESQACVADGCEGWQVCRDDGSRFDPCQCGTDPDAGTQPDAGTRPDSAPGQADAGVGTDSGVATPDANTGPPDANLTPDALVPECVPGVVYCPDDGDQCTRIDCIVDTCVPVNVNGAGCGPGLGTGTCYDGSCCEGCWDGDTCESGTAAAACGVKGAVCQVCPTRPCQIPVCAAPLCTYTPEESGTPCTTTGGLPGVCNASGACLL